MRDERSGLRTIGGTLAGLLMLLAFAMALPAHAMTAQECEDDSTCVYNKDPVTTTNTTTGGTSSIGDVEATVGNITGAGGNVNIDYPDQPVSSPAMATGGICNSGASVSTKGVGISIGTGDQLCRHMEVIRMGRFLKKDEDVKQLWEEAMAMERRGSWFRRCPLTGWITGLPIIGRLF